ncbi:5-methylcytosine rRNA methyltransferase NSUN4 [Venturia canescens]|uniref:5-methylcytosine rRNA methyltransferase NSUN4 n=1 Tax=Venturia canescens TaxID=32260 RepID=UPI001C9C169D|nr:5-methylcytosine rRNA methyltransferase NSUN4 [Venturia canescens]
MTFLLGRLKFNDIIKVPRRYKNGPEHWATLRKKKTSKDKALQHFDDFYSKVYGESWQLIRSALLKQSSKYIAVVNNFGNTKGTIEKFELMGAIDLKSIYEAQKRNLPIRNARAKIKASKMGKEKWTNEEEVETHSPLEQAMGEKLKELQSVYPPNYEPSVSSLEEATRNEERSKLAEPLSPVTMRSIEEEAVMDCKDHSRIVRSATGITSMTIHEYVPATKIKGLEDWILESSHYNYYDQDNDFSVQVEKDPVLSFPEHLKVYTFEALNDSKFPSPRRGTEGVYDFYLMDGGSILPVLALDLQPGDAVLDMCAAPGGKSLAALQTLMPRVLVANDVKLSRVNRLNNVIDEYFGDLDVWQDRLFVTNKDARVLEDTDTFNKILVDVPCTTDRHVLHEDENNIFKPTRIRERLQLPELQSEILGQALKIVAPGGTIVYSTCSLSPIQNDGVVQMALKKSWEETKSAFVVMDMMEALEPLRCLYKFGDYGLKYGHIVIPTKGNNWGPMYFCKITKLR